MTDGERIMFLIGIGVGALVCAISIVTLHTIDPLGLN